MHQKSGTKHHHPYLRRNFWAHCLEGGLYMAGSAFLSPEMAMPAFVQSLGGSAALVGLMPVLLNASMYTPGLFVAPLVERLHHFKPFVVFFGAFQRLPYLITALVLFFAPQLHSWLLPIVVLTPIVSGLLGGIGTNAWMEMVTRMIPEHLRASGWAIRYLIQGIVGLGAGLVIHFILQRFPGATGFAWLHLICFTFLTASYIAQWTMVEAIADKHKPTPSPQPYGAYLRELPGLLAGKPNLIKLALARFTGMGFLMMVSFMSIHALKVSQHPQEDVGYLVFASMVGGLAGNILAGWWGNRSGGRIVMIAARVLCIIMCLSAIWLTSFAAFLVASFTLGFGLFLDRVGDLTLAAELCPMERRPTYQGLLAICLVITSILAVRISAMLYGSTQSFTALCLLCAGFSLTSLILLCFIPEARTSHHASPVLGENPPMA